MNGEGDGDGGWARDGDGGKKRSLALCAGFPSRVLRAGPLALFSPGSLLQALEMQSTLGLGVAAMQGAPCRFFPNRSCLILRNQVRAHALHLHLDASHRGTVGSAKCESPPALRSLADPPSIRGRTPSTTKISTQYIPRVSTVAMQLSSRPLGGTGS